MAHPSIIHVLISALSLHPPIYQPINTAMCLWLYVQDILKPTMPLPPPTFQLLKVGDSTKQVIDSPPQSGSHKSISDSSMQRS